VIKPWVRKLIAEQKSRRNLRACDHCRTGKAMGSVYIGEATRWLCSRCAGAVQRTGSLP
jgi:hypothetical protein